MANWLTTKVMSWLGRAAEGQYRPGPYLITDGTSPNGWLGADIGRYWNWWQTGYRPQPYGERSAMVEACVSAYSQTVPMCPGTHWRSLDNGGRERVVNSALSRILKQPNDYQTISDFLLNLTRRLYEKGEAFAIAIRNNRGEIGELHLVRDGRATIAEEGSIFYSVYGNEILQLRFDLSQPIPARDILHVRLHTPRHPLRGESPILAATVDLAMASAARQQQVFFYLNQARPSFTLETDAVMKREQAQELRAWWDDQTQGENAGRTPILTGGLKAHPITTNAVDSQLAEMLKMTNENIALAMRIPLQILGLGGNTYSSTELLMQSWIASGLGFTLNHIEEAVGALFGLKGVPDEYLELDTRALLRSAYRERIEALARGVISGIYSPDEARASEDLPAVEDGYGAALEPPSPTPPALPAPADGGGTGTNTGDPNAADEQQQQSAAFRAAFRVAYDRHRLAA
jgi:HK97 family phage portal protein